MKISAKKLAAILMTALVCALSFSATHAYAYWPSYKSNLTLTVQAGKLGNYQSQLDRLPPNTPHDVRQNLEEFLENAPVYVVSALIDAVVDIVNTPMFEGGIHVSPDLEGFFGGNGKPIAAGDLLIYTVEGDNGVEFSIIHIGPDSSYQINSVEDLLNALTFTWTGINIISNTWIKGNAYTPLNSPVEHNGKYYMMYFSGPAGMPPDEDRNTWFEMSPDYGYSAANRYFEGSIVYRYNNYYYATQYATWAEPNSDPNPWDPWVIIEAYQSGGVYSGGDRVFTDGGEGSLARFWLALKATSAAPHEETARSGDWREIKKGWIGNGSDNKIRPYYFEHNTYDDGDFVIFGISPKLTYQYFRARKNVPCDQRPIIMNSEGVKVINDEYWENIYYAGR